MPSRRNLRVVKEIKRRQSVPWLSANDVRLSQIGTPLMGRSSTFPRIGYPFGPGGYGKVDFFRLQEKMRMETQSSSG